MNPPIKLLDLEDLINKRADAGDDLITFFRNVSSSLNTEGQAKVRFAPAGHTFTVHTLKEVGDLVNKRLVAMADEIDEFKESIVDAAYGQNPRAALQSDEDQDDVMLSDEVITEVNKLDDTIQFIEDCIEFVNERVQGKASGEPANTTTTTQPKAVEEVKPSWDRKVSFAQPLAKEDEEWQNQWFARTAHDPDEDDDDMDEDEDMDEERWNALQKATEDERNKDV